MTSLIYVHYADRCDVWSQRSGYAVLVARMPNAETYNGPGRHIFPNPLSALQDITSD